MSTANADASERQQHGPHVDRTGTKRKAKPTGEIFIQSMKLANDMDEEIIARVAKEIMNESEALESYNRMAGIYARIEKTMQEIKAAQYEELRAADGIGQQLAESHKRETNLAKRHKALKKLVQDQKKSMAQIEEVIVSDDELP